MHVVTRRRLIAYASFAVPLAGPCDALASGFWNRKDPAAWTPEEVQRVLTKSPWAKHVTAASRLQVEGRTPTTRGGPGSGRGGRGISLGGDAGPAGRPRVRDDVGGDVDVIRPEHQYRGIVRWESATPVRAASPAALPNPFAGHYVISLNDFPMGDVVSATGISQISPRDVTRIAAASFLTPKDKPGVRAQIAQTVGGTVLLGFAPLSLSLSLDDKEVTFAAIIGHLALQTKFHPKEMIYHGRLAL